MNTNKLFLALACTLALTSLTVQAADSVKSDVKSAAKTAKNDIKKTGRDISDKTCEMVNGKMECAAKKVKHKIQNTTDDLKN